MAKYLSPTRTAKRISRQSGAKIKKNYGRFRATISLIIGGSGVHSPSIESSLL